MFDFKEFIDNLRENSEKKEIVDKYEKLVESLPDKFEDTKIYKTYLSKFDTTWIDLVLPEFVDDDVDWDLLLKLIIASFSSTYILDLQENGKYELIINVSAGEKQITKKLSELWGFQIERMFEIYIEEQMNLEILLYENEKDFDIIQSQRESTIKKWQLVKEKILADKQTDDLEAEKQKKINDLLNQL